MIGPKIYALGQRIDNLKYGLNRNVNYTKDLLTNSIERIDIDGIKYELYRGIEKGVERVEKGVERVDYEFNRRIHIFLLLIFLTLSTVFVLYSYMTFGVPTMLYVIIIFTVALVGENMISRAGSYSYNMEHKPVIGRVPLFIPLLWVTMNLGSLFVSYITLSTVGITNGLYIVMLSAIIPLVFDLLLFEPKLSKDRKVWVWERTTRLYAPYGNYIVWFAFPFLANLLFMILI